MPRRPTELAVTELHLSRVRVYIYSPHVPRRPTELAVTELHLSRVYVYIYSPHVPRRATEPAVTELHLRALPAARVQTRLRTVHDPPGPSHAAGRALWRRGRTVR